MTGAASVVPGPAGTTGAAGTGVVSEYGYIFNVSAQVVAIEADISFSGNGAISSGVTPSPGGTTIVITTAGTYQMSFVVSAVEPNQFAIFQNGPPVTGGATVLAQGHNKPEAW